MKKYVFTESQLKKIIDNQVSESEEKKEFRPGVNIGKYNLKSFLKDRFVSSFIFNVSLIIVISFLINKDI
jgi:hypothetical protein